ncbi:NhaP-type Na+/H+ or K+/H+ antiporter [Paenibacillus cellulosilyticus]|uniref:NhaP-type Na+/H+ or K+/H+ antiporter n=1 Tax=Paenibacillus cellulosilyticus TaxID=375489 RepID=A0A2V2Y9M7_9BACL|nr:sodium:proton antiporter [Paenibacillus cellulosilyticus]PWV87848.1 NhaP-type Na+/H+ or K+/H+ antiporter [Paenibacillus cellulosilyticus]QKS47011.1 sodium:proton antiporter [Paenibacillus cellulosilyticus]
MESTTASTIQHIIILFILTAAAGIGSARIAAALRLPDVVLFIAAGMLLGQGVHWIDEPASSLVNQFILTVGSTLILFDGGRNIRLEGLRKVGWTVGLLSVPGVLITIAVTGSAIRIIFDIDWLIALLAGAVIASTDPASIIPVFRQVRIRKKVRETVESESAFNDATGSILTFALLAAVTGKSTLNVGAVAFDFAKTALGGIVVGIVLGIAILYLVAHASIGLFREFAAIAMLGTALAGYVVGDVLHVSGFMAAFAAGLIWGNSDLFGIYIEEKQQELTHVSDNVTAVMRMLIFVLLGSQVDFGLLAQYGWQSFIAVLVLMFIARPLTVLLCAWPDRKAQWTWKEMMFMVWVRETGVIPAALSGMLIGLGIPHASIIASITFMAIVLTIMLQASTTGWLAKKLGVDRG